MTCFKFTLRIRIKREVAGRLFELVFCDETNHLNDPIVCDAI